MKLFFIEEKKLKDFLRDVSRSRHEEVYVKNCVDKFLVILKEK